MGYTLLQSLANRAGGDTIAYFGALVNEKQRGTLSFATLLFDFLPNDFAGRCATLFFLASPGAAQVARPEPTRPVCPPEPPTVAPAPPAGADLPQVDPIICQDEAGQGSAAARGRRSGA